MKIIDFECVPGPGESLRFFRYGWVRVLEMGYKPWLEHPSEDAVAEGMEPILDIRPDSQMRGVHGYLAFGILGTVGDTGVQGAFADVNQRAMWYPAQFINMKDNFFEVPHLVDHGKEGVPLFNAVRIWTRWDVRLIAHFNTGGIQSVLQMGKVFDPSTGQQIGGF